MQDVLKIVHFLKSDCHGSLPEAATSLTATIKGQQDLAIANVLGSNIVNLMLILPLIGIIHPGTIQGFILSRDIPIMIGITLFSFFWIYSTHTISRRHGFILLMIYSGYLSYLAAPFWFMSKI